MSGAALAIEVCELRHSFGERVVLDGVDLSVGEGETLVILGGSGSGKSTLLRCLLGLERPRSGTVSILGTDIYSAPPRELQRVRRRIGMAFQRGALFGSLTLGENIDLPLAELTRLPVSTRRIIARIKLALVGLDRSARLYPSELSGGMIKRAAFARAMALDPDVLFCDEPSAGLDPVTAAGLDRLLVRLREVFGITLVVVTHSLDSAFAVADRIALLHEGRFIATDSPRRLRESTDPVVRRFLDREPEEEARDGRRFRSWMLETEAWSD